MADLDQQLDGRRVLIVDDDPVIRVVAGEALEGVGFVVEEAEDGEEEVRGTTPRREEGLGVGG